MSENKLAALVPMKGNSERVPNKNTRDFNGKPLLYWIINTLKSVEQIDDIIINTDSEKIINYCNDFFPNEVTIFNRPEYLCGGKISMNKIIKHDIEKMGEYKHFLQTHCTNPLLSSKTIKDAIELYFDKSNDNYDSLFSVNRIQCRCYDINGQPINHEFGQLKRTQDLEPVLEENSNLFIFSRDSFYNSSERRIGIKPYLYETNKYESIDIDEENDFIVAEKIHELNFLDS